MSIASTGQIDAQEPHPTHLFLSIVDLPRAFSLIAPTGHIEVQAPHPMQADSLTFAFLAIIIL
jgi:hypothetical protein